MDMRKVEFCDKGFFSHNKQNEPTEIFNGLFHGFYSEGNITDGLETYALVEMDSGVVRTIATHKIRFVDSFKDRTSCAPESGL